MKAVAFPRRFCAVSQSILYSGKQRLFLDYIGAYKFSHDKSWLNEFGISVFTYCEQVRDEEIMVEIGKKISKLEAQTKSYPQSLDYQPAWPPLSEFTLSCCWTSSFIHFSYEIKKLKISMSSEIRKKAESSPPACNQMLPELTS